MKTSAKYFGLVVGP